MKLKILFLLVVLVYLSFDTGASFNSDYKGVISVHASKYDANHILKTPQWTDSFNITIYKMRHSHLLDDLIVSKETYLVKNGVYHFAPDTGRYVVTVSQDTLSGILDFNYQGGNIAFTLLLQ
jgi:hypothetical protein